MYKKIVEVSKKVGVPVKNILEIFENLNNNPKIDNNILLKKTGIAKNALNQIKKEFEDYLMPASNFTELKSDKAKEVQQLFKIKRLPPKRNYDQFIATNKTINKRVRLLDKEADIRDKKILFLGDDDMTSVAVAMLQSANEIMVLDIDKKILKKIGRLSDEMNLNIKTQKYDARKPHNLIGKFDVVFTDPPYIPEGFNLFLSRAIDALDKSNNAARIYICYGNSDKARERFLEIQKIITDSGMMIRRVIDKFNRYDGAVSIGSASTIYILDITPKTKSLIKEDYDKPIYTNN